MALTVEEIVEISEVCYMCGDRRADGPYWEDGYAMTGLILCMDCCDDHDVQDIGDMPFVPIPTDEWGMDND